MTVETRHHGKKSEMDQYWTKNNVTKVFQRKNLTFGSASEIMGEWDEDPYIHTKGGHYTNESGHYGMIQSKINVWAHANRISCIGEPMLSKILVVFIVPNRAFFKTIKNCKT